MKYHIHVYRTIEKYEIDIEANDLNEALNNVKDILDKEEFELLGKPMKPEMEFIVMGFDDEE